VADARVKDAGVRAPAPPDHAGATARRLVLFAFLVYALTGGGRIVGSDEVTMLELSRSMLRGGIAVPEGATLQGPDGRHYTKNAPGQAVVALPLVALAEAAAGFPNLPPAKRELAARFAASFFNAFVVALLLGVFHLTARSLGASPRAALGGALMLGFATPFWPYAKSFMAEPLQALGLLLVAGGCAHAAAGDPRGGRVAAAGALLAVSVKLTMAPLALACMAPLVRRPLARWAWPLGGWVTALAVHGLYNLACFGTPFQSGYGAQASASAFTTPLLVGLYGLLLSSGKGVIWFAPPIVLAIVGWRFMTSRDAVAVGGIGLRARIGRLVRRLQGVPEPAPAAGVRVAARRVLPAVGLAWIVGLFMYARFEHWAGDGSFGPRYLVPLLPLAFLPVAFALERASFKRRLVARALAILGLLVQLGGVGIYFGAQMREAGDYPYALPLEHPRSLSDSHFNPAFSPIAGHWRMLTRNLGEHVRGNAPRFDPGGGGPTRLGLGAEDERRLLHAIDLWWLYLVYAGYPLAPMLGLAAALALAAIWARLGLRRAVRLEARAR
jgi:hypothetical protein